MSPIASDDEKDERGEFRETEFAAKTGHELGSSHHRHLEVGDKQIVRLRCWLTGFGGQEREGFSPAPANLDGPLQASSGPSFQIE